MCHLHGLDREVAFLLTMSLYGRTQLAEWQAAEGMTQHLVVKDDWLIQVSWGKVKIWSTKDYHLSNSVYMFDRAATDIILVNGMIVGCGRDASHGDDRCGLDEGLKGWRIIWENTKDEETRENSSGEEIEVGYQHEGPDDGVIRIGPPVRAARGLAALSDGRLVASVLRGNVWSVEIWGI